MKRITRYLSLLFLTSVLMNVHAFEIQDFAVHITLSDPQISPDEKRVAFVRISANEDLQYQYEIVLKDIEGAESKVLTSHSQYAKHPRWVSNSELSFLALTKEHGHQVFVLDLGNGQIRQLSHHNASVQGYSWSPDRSHLVYAARPKPTKSALKAFRVTRYSQSPPKPAQILYLLNVNTGENKKLNDASAIVDGWSKISWSPNGSNLLYMQKNPKHYDAYFSFLVEFNLSTGKERQLGVGAYPQYSPDGKKVLFLARETPEYPVGPRKAYILDPITGRIQRVAPTLDREVLGRFTPDGRVLLNGPEFAAQKLWFAGSGVVKPLNLVGVEPTWPLQASQSGSTLVFVGVSASRPQELYVYSAGDIRRITNENSALMKNRKRGSVQTLQWTTPDGLKITGIALFPPEFQDKKRYPLVVSPHGGPHTSSTVAGVASNLVNQTMASKGWIVLSLNYRGSTNQGRDFHLIRDGNPDYDRDVIKDVMSGVAALNIHCECIDLDQKAILGASYGGQMAAWATALHPSEWLASVVANASLDDVDMYARSDGVADFPMRFGGPPWSRELSKSYRWASPIYSAEQIITPTLIISTLRDPRVPVIQSFKFWKALEDNGVEVEFIAYDISGHGPSDLTNSIDYWERAVAWIAQHFRKEKHTKLTSEKS